MNLQQLLTLSWWFTLRPGFVESGLFRWGMIAIPVIFFVVAWWGFLKGRGNTFAFSKKWYSSLTKGLAAFGAMAMVLAFFAFQEIPFFSMRFFWFLWLLGLIIWGLLRTRSLARIPSKLKEAQRHKEDFLKYLPR